MAVYTILRSSHVLTSACAPRCRVAKKSIVVVVVVVVVVVGDTPLFRLVHLNLDYLIV